jgi:hypothetical protein
MIVSPESFPSTMVGEFISPIKSGNYNSSLIPFSTEINIGNRPSLYSAS